MDKACYYEIRIEGALTSGWSEWFENLEILTDASGNTTMSGWIIDQAALFSILMRIHNLNLTLISVARSIPG